MAAKRLYVAAYDISDNKKRNRAAGILKDYGCRVQKSVFECAVKAETMTALEEKIGKLIDPETDSLIVYPLCEACAKRRRSSGAAVFTEEEEFRVL